LLISTDETHSPVTQLLTYPKFHQNKAQVAELNRFFSGNRGL
jgi:hypothetical protein